MLQGNKKLDKAEILEMTIEYIQRLQGGVGGARGLDLSLSQKDWATDLTTWVIQNKILHSGESPGLPLSLPATHNQPLASTGPHSLDSFCQALLLHLQNCGSGSSLSSASSLLVNQVVWCHSVNTCCMQNPP